MQIDNHWNYGSEYRREMSAPYDVDDEYEEELYDYLSEEADRDERIDDED